MGGDSHTLLRLEERLEVGKRVVETGRVQVTTRVVTSEQLVEMQLRRESVEVERVSVNRVVEHAGPIRHEGDVMIVPLYEEVLVVTKQLVLKEELRIRRHSSLQPSVQRFALRREEAQITRSSPDDGAC